MIITFISPGHAGLKTNIQLIKNTKMTSKYTFSNLEMNIQEIKETREHLKIVWNDLVISIITEEVECD